MTLTSFAKGVEKFVQDNSPAILTAIGVVGTVSTAYFTGKASFKAAEIIRDQELAMKDGKPIFVPMDLRGKFELTWKLYIPAVGTGAMTIACIICANRIGNRRAAAMAAAYSISERAFTEYKEKVVEKIGANKERAVRDELAQDRVNRNPKTQNEVIISGGGEVLCYDEYSGRYFESSMEEIKKAMNDTNYRILNDGFASLGDFYERLSLPSTKYSEEVGWNTDHPLEIMFSTTMSDDNKPCLAIDYQTVPTRGFNRFH
jgi:hypothetical protein